MYWTAISSNGEAVNGKDGAPLRSLRLDSDELEAMMAPCRGPVGQDYEVARRSDPTGWGSKEGIQSLAGAFLSTVTLQPICCAPDRLLPPNMTNKAYDLVRIGAFRTQPQAARHWDPIGLLQSRRCHSLQIAYQRCTGRVVEAATVDLREGQQARSSYPPLPLSWQ
jgi:hypothetical protein